MREIGCSERKWAIRERKEERKKRRGSENWDTFESLTRIPVSHADVVSLRCDTKPHKGCGGEHEDNNPTGDLNPTGELNPPREMNSTEDL